MRVLSSRVFVSKAASYCTGPGTTKTVVNTRLKIGDVSVDLKTPKRLEFVPRGYASINAPQSTLNHLKWLLQKDGLKQDVFLIGIPGTTRINLVLQYLELANREYEYLPITRDTTEADIKQRREIRSGTAYYVDLCAIRAAIEGRVLVIDGVEKAERNVLPILNNLLENREVQLDDGRFLVAPEKYDKLLKDHSLDELKAWKLERVSTDFQVIALGLPVPKFRGHTLDPPLRSRFQSRNVQTLPYEECFRLLKSIAPNITPDRLTALISTAYAMNAEESGSVGLPQFPIDNLSIGAAIWNLNPEFSTDYIMRLLYPHRSMLKKEAQDQVHSYYNTFNVNTSIDKTKLTNSIATLPSVDQHDNSSITTDVHYTWADKDHKLKLTVLCGTNQSDSNNNNNSVYVPTNSHNRLLTEMCLSHAIGDFCLIGGKGCGKTTLVHKFANMLNYDVTTVMLYQDMSSRELLQQRRMLPNGDTIWEDSVIVNAAKSGHLCILDGLHRIHHSALNVLQRLVHHRELHLFDGTRLLSKSRYDHVKAVAQLNDTQLADRKIFAIDERFRLVGIAEPPNVHDSSQHWLTPELLTLFVHHEIAPLSADEEATVISARIPDVSSQVERMLLEFVATMRQSPDTNFRSIADSLSTRQLLRIMRRLTAHSDESLRFLIKKACLSRFLPHLTKSSLDDALDRSKITAPLAKSTTSTTSPLKCETRDGIVQIGNTFAKSFAPLNRTMVPDILFYDNEQHIRVMEDMLRDFQLGEHLLLIGNQGVGKNKVADRFLQLLNRPRQYIQLHRDTTVQTLTLQANVIDGILVYEDSPLVKAVKHGDILVVDEGDKAPTHVTCVLKSLLESQQMHLADGRRIVPTDYIGNVDPANTIRMHRDFRMIVLANRPGFPFLGNDFFGALGDLFACHTIDNPGRDSELQMLRKYGPNVPVETLDKLVSAFDELRLLADQGLLNYPYSTRELVNIIRHLNRYPTDGLPSVVSNVFDFDAFSADSMESVVTVLRRNGIPIGVRNSVEQIKLAASFPMPPIKQIGQWHISTNSSPTSVASHTVSLADTIKKPFRYTPSRFAVDRTDMRVSSFTEQAISWQLPVQDVTICSDVVYCDGHICVATINPLSIFILDNLNDSMASSIDLTEMFPSTRGQFRPRLRLAPLSERRVLVHEEMTNTLLLLNINDQTCASIDIASENLLNTLLSKRTVDSSTNHWRMSGSQQAQQSQQVYLYRRNSNLIKMVDFYNGQISEMTLPNDVHIIHCCPIDTNQLLINTTNGYKLLDKQQSSSHRLYSVECSGDIPHIDKSVSISNDASSTMLTEIETKSSSSSRLFSAEQYHALVGDLSNLLTAKKCAIYGIRRIENEDSVDSRKPYWASSDIWRQFSNPETNSVLLTDPIQCIRVLPNWRTPSKVMTKDINLNHTAAFLEISDLSSRQTSYIPVPTAKYQCYNSSWLSSLMESTVLLTAAPTKGIVTCDNSGGIRLWQTDQTMLNSSISAWKKMFGTDNERLRIEYDRNENEADMSKLEDPKIGKFDPSNTPHMGGNTWAGGTGGYSTAGLGGIGGPFRLDAGNDVAQMPDSVKEQVPEHIRQKARQVAREEYQKRLREIDMTEYDADAYNQLYTKIAKQSAQLKVVIENLQAKSKERQWMRHQTSGDLDEGKLIEGLVGDKTIYRRRVEKQPEPGTPIMKPKRMRICVDVSGSMYRFNGYDGRLQRTLESCLMVMDSLDHHADKMKYDIVGHSGDQPDFPFVNVDRPPSNEKERLDVLKKMLLHAQFCVSGDNTLEATKDAIDTLIAEGDDTVDERFVIVLSDANLDRYGIRARDLATLMERDERVHVFIVLIGSLGEQANRLRSALPVGKAFVCQNTGDLPHIMQTIFASTLFDTTPSG